MLPKKFTVKAPTMFKNSAYAKHETFIYSPPHPVFVKAFLKITFPFFRTPIFLSQGGI